MASVFSNSQRKILNSTEAIKHSCAGDAVLEGLPYASYAVLYSTECVVACSIVSYIMLYCRVYVSGFRV